MIKIYNTDILTDKFEEINEYRDLSFGIFLKFRKKLSTELLHFC